jgi:hypothetical protein
MKFDVLPVLSKDGWRIGADVMGDMIVYDTDRDAAVAKRYAVTTVPTLICVVRGAEVRRITGFCSPDQIRNLWGDHPPRRKQAVSGPKWHYYGTDLARHLIETHSLTPGEIAGLSHAELVRVHSDAHNEGR